MSISLPSAYLSSGTEIEVESIEGKLAHCLCIKDSGERPDRIIPGNRFTFAVYDMEVWEETYEEEIERGLRENPEYILNFGE
ncbi:hypothetical protein [Pseudovibrio sp. Tun.PSC04-5.I4]|uniref:hypothetical protein n=1 Tax=Pseudovibrio sp. Tun.PSC04-5.I4 TaxID=1798213 RepID=UPI00087FA48C|nr:hypothetical protein [Pseudovibrio sp. Tun.PSC04-5.I4]SDR01861.1 hypothetical protein SAMN04515695_2340 [Pseudovibrio sp. Tun.PSC04-5.I4]